MTIKDEDLATRMLRGQKFMAAGGMLSALAASSCCILPLMLFSLGVSGAWIGNFTRLAPYQPYFIAATFVFLGYGYWLVYQSRTHACAEGEACARPLPNRIVKASLFACRIMVSNTGASPEARRLFSTLLWTVDWTWYFVTIIPSGSMSSPISCENSPTRVTI